MNQAQVEAEKGSRYMRALEMLAQLGIDPKVLDDFETAGIKGYFVYRDGAVFAGELQKRMTRPVMGVETVHYVVKGRTNSFVAFGEKDAPPEPFEGEFQVTSRIALEAFEGRVNVGRNIAAAVHGERKSVAGPYSYFDCDPFILPAGQELRFTGPLARGFRIADLPKTEAKTVASSGAGAADGSPGESFADAEEEHEAEAAKGRGPLASNKSVGGKKR